LLGSLFAELAAACCAWNQVMKADGITPGIDTA
jgi:hypothetical protein